MLIEDTAKVSLKFVVSKTHWSRTNYPERKTRKKGKILTELKNELREISPSYLHANFCSVL